jgi:hypothetical protein
VQATGSSDRSRFHAFCFATPERPAAQWDSPAPSPSRQPEPRLSRQRHWLRPSPARPGCLPTRVRAPLGAKAPRYAARRKEHGFNRTHREDHPNDHGNPPGKLADAELHFAGGPLDGLKLIGFSIWERRGGGGRNVTFPARQYSVNGERRSFALLRPIADISAQHRIGELVLAAYAEFEERAEVNT